MIYLHSMYNKDVKKQAFLLRKEGKSYNSISQELNITKSTLSQWFLNVDWSQEVRKKLIESSKEKSRIHIENLNKTRGKNLEISYKQAEDEALNDLAKLQYNPLFIAGVMLYWGEGDKRNKNNVKFINTDPNMIVLYCDFLRKICDVPEEKIKAGLFIYDNIDELNAINFWSDKTKITKDRFHKTIKLVSKSEKRRVPFGICLITVSNSFLKKKFLVWLEKLPLELLSKSYYNL